MVYGMPVHCYVLSSQAVAAADVEAEFVFDRNTKLCSNKSKKENKNAALI